MPTELSLYEILYAILIASIILFFILEVVFTLLWVSFYMRIGIPLFITRFSISDRGEFEKASMKLIEEGVEGKWLPSLVFKQISKTEVAFNNKLFAAKGAPLYMRGIIVLDSSNQIEIKCFWPFFILPVFVASIIPPLPWFGSMFEELPRYALLSLQVGAFIVMILIHLAGYRHLVNELRPTLSETKNK